MTILLFSVILSFSISLIWIYYLKRIDLFERELAWHIALVFVLGCLSPFLIDVLHAFVFRPLNISKNGAWINDFFYYVFAVGLPEEILKFLPAYLLVITAKKAGNEPLDYILFASVSALAFAFHENIQYVMNYGLGVLSSRAILSVSAHMFFSATFMYGIVLARFHNSKPGKMNIPLFMLLAIASHGFYDFWLTRESMALVIITILFYFFTISVFITILNNCMNNSPFYTPKKVIDSEKVSRELALFYLVVLAAIIAAVSFTEDYMTGMGLAIYLVIFRAVILGVLIVRLSRFKIIPGRWNKIKLELPFSVVSVQARESYHGGGSFLRIKVKGESFNEVYLNSYLEEHFELLPVSAKKTHIGQKRVAVMEKKLFLENDETFYLLRVIVTLEPEQSIFYLLKAKTSGSSRTPQGYPIAALLKIKDTQKLNDENSGMKDFPFLEWVILRPLKA